MSPSPPLSRPLFRLRGETGERRLILELPKGEHTVGSSKQSDLHLPFAGVSRFHARIRATPEGLSIEDVGSKNGTFVDGRRISRAAAGAGARIALGPVELEIEPLEEGADLAIRFERQDESSSLAGREYSETLLIPKIDGIRPDEMALLAELSEPLGDGDVGDGLCQLCGYLRLDGAALIRWSKRDEPLALAAWGTFGLLPSWERIRALPSPEPPDPRTEQIPEAGADRPSTDRDRHGPWYCGGFEGGVIVARTTRAPEDGHQGKTSNNGLVLWGRNTEKISAQFLRLLLLLFLGARSQPESRDRPKSPDAEGLRFPKGYVRGLSDTMRELYRQMSVVRRLRGPVLLHGETGVGKEMLARALHDSSRRAAGPYVVVNCAAIAENLLEAEMFGITKGAATGVEAREGYFVRAEGGTLFLDEIGELPKALQAKLLRTLQEGEVQPVGGRPRSVDVRVIAATNVALEADRLRADLYYRFAAGLLEIPPLRQRRDDIPALVRHFANLAAIELDIHLRGITTRALECLRAFDWPGNVRQLAQVVRRSVALAEDGIVDRELLPDELRRVAPTLPAERAVAELADLRLKPRIERLERRLILEALARSGGHQIRAAEMLGVSRSGLAKKLKRLGLAESWALEPRGKAAR